MKFSTSGTTSRTSRKIRRKSVSARTEACELRSLLSASVITVAAVDNSDLPMDGGEDASAKVDATEIGSLLGAPIDPDFTETKPGEPGCEDGVFYTDGDSGIPVADPSEFIRFNMLFTTDDPGAIDGTEGEKLSVGEEVSFEDAPTEDWDPSWAYRSFVTVAGDETDGSVEGVDETHVSPNIYFSLKPDDAVIEGEVLSGDESADGEKVANDESVILEDTSPIEGWDPSWLYRTLTSVAGDGSEEIIVDQGTGWEDGLGCGVAADGLAPGDLTPIDSDGDGVPDDFVMYAFDPLPLEEVSGEPVDVMYFGGLNLEPVDGEVAVEVDQPASDPNEEVDHVFDLLPLDDVSGEPVGMLEDGELVPIRTLESSDSDPAVIFYSAAGGGEELQRTNDNGSVQEETAVVSTVAIPVKPSASNSLFHADRGRASVGIPVGVQTTSDLGNTSSPAKRNTTQRRSSTQVAATRPSAASEGLNSLTPLLGGEAGQSENDSPENAVGPQDVESGSVEATVSDSGHASSVASGFAANQSYPARNARTSMIDRVMAQYAENSFNS